MKKIFGFTATFALTLALFSASTPAQAHMHLRAMPNGWVESYSGTRNFYQSIANGSDSRQALIFTPTSGTTNGTAIIALHASGENQSQMANLTQAGKLAAKGTVVVFPAALDDDGGEWNDTVGPDATSTNDVGYITAVAHYLASQYHVTRIVLTGYSNGGFMTSRMLCDQPGLASAALIVAANVREPVMQACQASSINVPVFIIQGTADPVVYYRGMPYQDIPSAEQALSFFQKKAGCNNSSIPAPQPLATTTHDGTSVSLQTACNVRLYTVQSGGHTWPDGDTNFSVISMFLGKTSHNLDATGLLAQLAGD